MTKSPFTKINKLVPPQSLRAIYAAAVIVYRFVKILYKLCRLFSDNMKCLYDYVLTIFISVYLVCYQLCSCKNVVVIEIKTFD